MTNKKDFAILEKIEFLKQLKNEDKESLLELINDKDTEVKLESIERVIKYYLERERISYDHKIVIKNNKHILTIFYKKYPLEYLIENLEEDGYNIQIGDLQNENEAHHLIGLKNNFGDTYITDFTGNAYDDTGNVYGDFFHFNVVFCLDNRLLAIRSYNQDPVFFLKNTSCYTAKSFYDFFSEDLEEFNKTNYEVLALFKAQKYFNMINVYDYFNNMFEEYRLDNSNYSKYYHNLLAQCYIKTFLIPKFQSLIKPNLDVLAKNRLKYKLKCYKVWNDSFDVRIVKEKDNKSIFSLRLTYDEFKKENFIRWEESIIKLANNTNQYLQHNILVAYNLIEKRLNYTDNNININSMKKDDKVYISKNLQISYGYLKNNINDHKMPYLNDEDLLLIWKFKDNSLEYEFFKVYDLCIYLAKNHNNLDNIVLKNKIEKAKDFTKIVYIIHNGEIYFEVDLPYKNKFIEWKNNLLLNTNLNLKDYSNYSDFIENHWLYDDEKVTFLFVISGDGVGANLNNIYNDLKEQIILKETVKAKIQ